MGLGLVDDVEDFGRVEGDVAPAGGGVVQREVREEHDFLVARVAVGERRAQPLALRGAARAVERHEPELFAAHAPEEVDVPFSEHVVRVVLAYTRKPHTLLRAP